MHNQDDDFVPVKGIDMEVGMYMMVKEHPCKIIKKSHSKPGKTGWPKALYTCIDIFDGKKYEVMIRDHEVADKLDIVPKDHKFVTIDGTDVVLSDLETGMETADLAMPEEGDKFYDELMARMEKEDDFIITIIEYEDQL